MLDHVRVTDLSLAAEYASHHRYKVWKVQGCYYGVCFCEQSGRFHYAKGHRTGEPVTFSRRSDAERFAKNRNQICQGAY